MALNPKGKKYLEDRRGSLLLLPLATKPISDGIKADRNILRILKRIG